MKFRPYHFGVIDPSLVLKAQMLDRARGVPLSLEAKTKAGQGSKTMLDKVVEQMPVVSRNDQPRFRSGRPVKS